MQIVSEHLYHESAQCSRELLENLNEILKDTDAGTEKEILKQFLQNTSDVFRFVVVGSSCAGKTTLLQNMFGKEVIADIQPTQKICEYRYGEQAGEFLTDVDTVRFFRPAAVLQGICVVDLPGTDWIKTAARKDAVQNQILKSDVQIAVFSSDALSAAGVWDLLEQTEAKRAVFVITKAKQQTDQQKEEGKRKLKKYGAEAGIHAEIFYADCPEELHDYIYKQIICTNPGLRKQRENILGLQTMLTELAQSFLLRKKQYEADLEVAERIDQEMDVFFRTGGELAEDLKNNLAKEIEREIQAYEDEIVARLEPEKIRERFPGGYEDFVNYLNFMNESYRERMTCQVNQKMQNSVQEYVSELEQVFDRATGYFRKRASMLSFEDQFYGSLAQSRQFVTVKTEKSLQKTKNDYHVLSNASQELFLKLWSAREQYDHKVSKAGTIGAAAGAAAGTGGIYLAAAAVSSALSGAAGTGAAAAGISQAAAGIAASALSAVTTSAVTTAAFILWPVAALAGAAAIAKMAKKLASAKGIEQMRNCVKEAVEEFHQEVAGTKKQMTAQILDTVDTIFKKERESADQTFSDYRRSVHIDGKNIPALEEKLVRVQALMERIAQIDAGGGEKKERLPQNG